ncbi:MAG: glutathione S-transferase family protein [Alphaproteobacteria bacterium]
MKLVMLSTSPFVRMVRAVAVETGLADRINLDFQELTDRSNTIAKVNPIGKVPSLILDDGEILFDSRVICEYLDGLHDGPKLFPANGMARIRALRMLAVANGIGDAMVVLRTESLRKPEMQSQSSIKYQTAKQQRCLDFIEAHADGFAGTDPGAPIDIGELAAAAVIAAFAPSRTDEIFTAERPKITAWHAAMRERPCIRDTVPPPD